MQSDEGPSIHETQQDAATKRVEDSKPNISLQDNLNGVTVKTEAAEEVQTAVKQEMLETQTVVKQESSKLNVQPRMVTSQTVIKQEGPSLQDDKQEASGDVSPNYTITQAAHLRSEHIGSSSSRLQGALKREEQQPNLQKTEATKRKFPAPPHSGSLPTAETTVTNSCKRSGSVADQHEGDEDNDDGEETDHDQQTKSRKTRKVATSCTLCYRDDCISFKGCSHRLCLRHTCTQRVRAAESLTLLGGQTMRLRVYVPTVRLPALQQGDQCPLCQCAAFKGPWNDKTSRKIIMLIPVLTKRSNCIESKTLAEVPCQEHFIEV